MRRFIPALFYHRIIDIGKDDRAIWPDRPLHEYGQIACAAANVDYSFTLLETDKAHRLALPEIMDPEARKGIRDIIPAGNAVKVLKDPSGLFFFGHLFVAEVHKPGPIHGPYP